MAVALLRGDYKLSKGKYTFFDVLHGIYNSLYSYKNPENSLWIFGILILIFIFIGHNQIGTLHSFLQYFSFILSAIYNYYVHIWLTFFVLFGYAGKMNYIFPKMKNGDLSGNGFLLAFINIVVGIIFLILAAEPTIQAKRSNKNN